MHTHCALKWSFMVRSVSVACSITPNLHVWNLGLYPSWQKHICAWRSRQSEHMYFYSSNARVLWASSKMHSRGSNEIHFHPMSASQEMAISIITCEHMADPSFLLSPHKNESRLFSHTAPWVRVQYSQIILLRRLSMFLVMTHRTYWQCILVLGGLR